MPGSRRVPALAALVLLAPGSLPVSAQPPPPPPLLPPAPAEKRKPLTPGEVGRRIGGPTLVTLQFKDAPAKDVYEALARQAGIVWREAEPVWQRNLPPLTVDIQRQPFWRALNTLEEKTGIGLVRWGGEPGYWLGFRGGERTLLSGVPAASGPFLLVAHQIERSESFSLALGAGGEPRGRRLLQIGLLLFLDPKVRVGRVGSLRVEDVVDDDLRSLLAENSPREQALYGASTIPIEGTIGFTLPEKRGRRIQRLMGTLRLTTLSRSERWEIPLGATATLPEIRKVLPDPDRGDRTFSVSALRPGDGAPGYELELSYSVPRARGFNRAFPMDVGDVFTGIRLLDAQGREWRRSGGTVSGGGDGARMRYTFYGTFGGRVASGAGNEAPPGEPTRLIWDLPVEYQDVEVPFEFNDLPLP